MRQLAGRVQGVQRTRTELAGDLDRLQPELEQAEQRTTAKQREYLQARDASQNLAQRVNDLKYGHWGLAWVCACARACALVVRANLALDGNLQHAAMLSICCVHVACHLL